MSKEFDVNSKVNFPYKIVSKDIDGYHIVIAPDYPNWIVLDDREYEIFRILSNNTIIDGLNEYYAAFPGNTEDDCVLAFTNFLAKIEDCQFYADAADDRVRMEAPEIFRVLGKRRPEFVRPYLVRLQRMAEKDSNRVVRIHCLGAIKAAER